MNAPRATTGQQLSGRSPWPWDCCARLFERSKRDYAQQLLDALPFVPDDSRIAQPFIDAYRAADRARAKSAWRRHRAGGRGLTNGLEVTRAKAEAAHAAWELIHRHLVAVRMAELYVQGTQAGALEVVLVAEHDVEALAEGVA